MLEVDYMWGILAFKPVQGEQVPIRGRYCVILICELWLRASDKGLHVSSVNTAPHYFEAISVQGMGYLL
jgi:hypothetical protein